MDTQDLKEKAEQLKGKAKELYESPGVQGVIDKGKDLAAKGKDYVEKGKEWLHSPDGQQYVEKGKEYLEKGKELFGNAKDNLKDFVDKKK